MIDQTRQIDVPEVGYYRIRLVRKGPWVAARIMHGAYGWRATVQGWSCGFANQDPHMADGVARIHHYGHKITKAEYDRLLPHASPHKPVDLRHEPIPF